MRRTLVIAVLALTATSIALGQKQSASKDQRSSVEQAIRQLDHERIQAQIGADAAALDRIYADDFIGVGPSGTVRTKTQVLVSPKDREGFLQALLHACPHLRRQGDGLRRT